MRAKVAVIKTRPESIIEDIDGLVETAGLEEALPSDKTTILKDNISWHMPFLSANTTPWQLEGIIKALRNRGYQDVVCVENCACPYVKIRLRLMIPLMNDIP